RRTRVPPWGCARPSKLTCASRRLRPDVLLTTTSKVRNSVTSVGVDRVQAPISRAINRAVSVETIRLRAPPRGRREGGRGALRAMKVDVGLIMESWAAGRVQQVAGDV